MQTWMRTDYSFLLNAQEVAVWKIDFPAHQPFIQRYRAILSTDEKARADNYYFEKDRDAFIITRACLRLLLARYLNLNPAKIIFSKNTHDKPELGEDIFQFNVSHSEERALIAFTPKELLGVDIEYTKREVEYLELALRFFADEEVQQLLSAKSKQNQAEIFFNIWTRKEAFIKAIGRGLSFPLRDFSVQGLPNAEPAFLRLPEPEYPLTEWQLVNLEIENNYRAALACTQKIKKIYCWEMAVSELF